MASNTVLADINEIYLGLYLNGGKSYDSEADKHLKTRIRQARPSEVLDQNEKAFAMAQAIIKWAKANKYTGIIKNVFWTARSGKLQETVGREVDSKKNPADILIQFSDGKFLGVSAKSSKNIYRVDIAFKNPGLGTVEVELKINIRKQIQKIEDSAVKTFGLPQSLTEREIKIRKNLALQKRTNLAGSTLLMAIRDIFFAKLKTMKQEDLRKYILNSWLDSNENLFPVYVKVTGIGDHPPYAARVDDPLNNSKLKSLKNGKITVELVTDDTIGVKADGVRILKIRAKYKAIKLASSIKFSGEPW